MKVLSLFDGMACGALAMQSAGLEVERYVAYEYDEDTADTKKGRPFGWAALTASHNFPMIEQKGNVFDGDFTEFKDYDYLVGGSPCTYWSIAQKNNRETEASGLGWELFSQYVRALREAQPKFFIYENNKSMSSAIRQSITETFGFEPILINSALVSAQNRQRLYWVGRRNEEGTYSKVIIEQPEDRGILLRDILESGVVENAYAINTCDGGKSRTIKAQYSKNSVANFCCYTSTYGATGVAEPVCVAQRGRYADSGNRTVKGNGSIEQFYEAREDGKTNALTTVQKDNSIAEPVRVGCYPSPDGTIKNSQGMRLYSIDGKSVNLTALGGGMGAKTGLYAVPTELNEKQQPIYEVKDGLITIKDKQYPIKLLDGFYIIRKLTVRECMRLQTVPEWYQFPVSDTQAYKMLGNGWTVDVIAHLLNATKEAI